MTAASVVDAPSRPSGRRDVIALLAINLLVSVATIVVAQQPHSLAPLWFANSIAIAFVVTAPRQRTLALLGAATLANVLANLLTGDTAASSVMFSAINAIEIAVGARLLRRLHPNEDFTARLDTFLRVMVAGALLAPLIGAAIAATWLSVGSWGNFPSLWLRWYIGSIVSATTMLPLALSLRLRKENASSLTPRSLLLSGLVLGFVMAAFELLAYPFAVVATLLVLLATAVSPLRSFTLSLKVVCGVTLALALGWFSPRVSPSPLGGVQIYVYVLFVVVPAQLVAVLATRQRALTAMLEQAVTELRQANSDLEHFVRIASHDLREPLNTITQFCDLLTRQPDFASDQVASRYFGLVRAGAQRMRVLLDDVLLFVRATTGPNATIEAARTSVDLDEIAREVAQSLHAQLEVSGGRLDLGALGSVMGHRSSLSLALQNLISNALKFRAVERPPHVTVSVTRDSQACTISVTDNGIGIAPEHVRELGLPFRRLHSRRKFEGSGLGLAICKRIAEQHGGTLVIESTLGEGSRFHLVLPHVPPVRAARTLELADAALPATAHRDAVAASPSA